MKTILIAFYESYLSLDSNIGRTAEIHEITNAECYLLVKIGKRLSGK